MRGAHGYCGSGAALHFLFNKIKGYMKKSAVNRIVSMSLVLSMMAGATGPAAAGNIMPLSAPGVMVRPSASYMPPHLVGLVLHPDNPFRMDFIVDKADSGISYKDKEFKVETERLVKDFLTALTVPEKEQWVNLSPYEPQRIAGDGLSRTVMGRDMLAQDYMLKQLAASLLYPEESLGRSFWARLYEQAAKAAGINSLPADVFHKVWIAPDKGVVLVKNNKVFVVEQHLKVMLEQDYLASRASQGSMEERINGADAQQEPLLKAMREVVIPVIEKEVNAGENFARLRQIYSAMILAAWYKKHLRDSILGRAYAGKNRTAGLAQAEENENSRIYAQYMEAFKSGVYNIIKEEVDPATELQLPRKYFSGGEVGFAVKDLAYATQPQAEAWTEKMASRQVGRVAVDLAQLTGGVVKKAAESRAASAHVVRMIPGRSVLADQQVVQAVTAQLPAAGVLMPIAALRPSSYEFGRDTGIGDFGIGAREFVLFLSKAGVRDWLVLPPYTTDPGGCNYYGDSLFALNLDLISPSGLLGRGLITSEEYQKAIPFDLASGRVPFEQLMYKEQLMRVAYRHFRERGGALIEKFADFKRHQDAREVKAGSKTLRIDWLDQFALFRAIGKVHGDHDWRQWPQGLRDKNPSAIEEFRAAHANEIDFIKFYQFMLRWQWDELKRFAKDNNVRILSDMPIYPRLNSADVWANQGAFIYDAKAGLLTVHSGVPADQFSAEGQDWGHPIYNWMSREGEDFLLKRFVYSIELSDGDPLRIDHFIGMADPWVVPEGVKALNGYRLRDKYPQADPKRLFADLLEMYPNLSDLLFAEDLGAMTDRTRELLEFTGLKGMGIMQFLPLGASDNEVRGHVYNPRELSSNTVVFNATHDNDTTRSWYRKLDEQARGRLSLLMKEAGIMEDVTDENVAVLMNRLMAGSRADMAIFHYADLLPDADGKPGLVDARYNVPGTTDPKNWSWRMPMGALEGEVSGDLRDLTVSTRRSKDKAWERREALRIDAEVSRLALAYLAKGGARAKQLSERLVPMLNDGLVRRADLKQGIAAVNYLHPDGREYILLSTNEAVLNGGLLTIPQQAASVILALDALVPMSDQQRADFSDMPDQLKGLFDQHQAELDRFVQDDQMLERAVSFLGAMVNADILDNELDEDTRIRIRRAGLSPWRGYYTQRFAQMWGKIFSTYEKQLARRDLLVGLIRGTLPLISRGEMQELVWLLSEAFPEGDLKKMSASMPYLPTENALNRLKSAVTASVANTLAGKLSDGLSRHRSFLHEPTGQESGYFLATDWGGTNFRVVLVHLTAGQPPAVLEKYTVKDAFSEQMIRGEVSNDAVLDFVAGNVTNLIGKVKGDPQADPTILSGVLNTGAGFSFPASVAASNFVQLDKSNIKGWKLEGWSRQESGDAAPNVVELHQQAFDRQAGLKGRVKVKTMPNDTIAVGLAVNADFGLIGGTGANVAIKEQTTGEFINLEFGAFGAIAEDVWSDVDKQVFDEVQPGIQKWEKMVAGKYLIEQLKRYLRSEVVHSAPLQKMFAHSEIDSRVLSFAADMNMSVVQKNSGLREKFNDDFGLTEDDWRILAEPSRILLVRSGQIIGASLSGMIEAADPRRKLASPVIGFDGSVIANPLVRQSAEEVIVKFTGRRAVFKTVPEATAIGTAISAAIGTFDSAMTPGGITLDSNLLNLQVNGDALPEQLPASPWDQVQISGLEPHVMAVLPVSMVSLLE